MEIETGIVFALETYCRATDRYSAAPVEQEVGVIDTGPTMISLSRPKSRPISNRC
jgi:Xaa-Pro aminopeptidase